MQRAMVRLAVRSSLDVPHGRGLGRFLAVSDFSRRPFSDLFAHINSINKNLSIDETKSDRTPSVGGALELYLWASAKWMNGWRR